MKKILSFALAGMMLLSSLAASVTAADNAEDTRYKGDENNGFVQTVQAYALPVAPTFDLDDKGNPTNTTLLETGAIDRTVWGEPTVVAKASDANTHATREGNNNPLFAWEKSFEDRYKEDKDNATNTEDGAWSKLEYNLWLAWDNTNFYVAAEIKDPDGYSLTAGSASIWDGDALQFMIDPLGPNGVMKVGDPDYDYTKTHLDWWTYKGKPWSNLNCMLNIGVGDVSGLKRNRYQVVNMANTEAGTIMNDPKSERGVYLNIVNADENTANPNVTVMMLAMPWTEIVDTASFIGNLGLENFGAGYTLGMSASVLNAANPSKVPGSDGKWNSYLNWGAGVTGASADTTAKWFPYVNQGSNAVVLSDKSALDHDTTVDGMRQAEPVKPIEHVDQVLYFDLADKNNTLQTDVDVYSYNAESGYATAVDMAITELDPTDSSRSLVGFWIGDTYSVYAGYDITEKQFVLAQQDTSNGIKRDNIYKKSDKTYDWQVADKDNDKPAEWGRLGLVQVGDTVKLYFNGELVLEDTNARYGHSEGEWLLNRSLIIYNSAAVVLDNWVAGSANYNLLAGEDAKADKIDFSFNFDTDDQAFNASSLRGSAEAMEIARVPYAPNDKEAEAYYADKAGAGPVVEYTPGDVNGDGDLNAKDIMAIMKHLLNNTPEGFIAEAADFNNDGDINAKDIMAIMREILNKK